MRLSLTDELRGEDPCEDLLEVLMSLLMDSALKLSNRLLTVGGVEKLSDASCAGDSGEAIMEGSINR